MVYKYTYIKNYIYIYIHVYLNKFLIYKCVRDFLGTCMEDVLSVRLLRGMVCFSTNLDVLSVWFLGTF